ncbi:MAG: phosphoribosylanthranilate isomerase [Acetobacter sp.]|nr:phosphoribosylanthranilate isomerase [Acetobacter sp.]
MVQIKICGITEKEGLETCVRCGVDWVGFVFFEKSPRFLAPEQAATLSSFVQQGGPQRVGLFVEPDFEKVANILAHVRLDVLQLYTDMEKAVLFARYFRRPVWVSLPISQRSELPYSLPTEIERVLIEPKPPLHATQPGGNGQSMEWSLLEGWCPSFPWMLAGGLTPENVAEAIKQTGTSSVDVSSGVEVTRGVKSADLITHFVKEARRAL